MMVLGLAVGLTLFQCYCGVWVSNGLTLFQCLYCVVGLAVGLTLFQLYCGVGVSHWDDTTSLASIVWWCWG